MLTLTIVLLVYTMGVVGTYTWMQNILDVENLIDEDVSWVPYMWPILASAYIWERIRNG
jgi:hypothetical protein